MKDFILKVDGTKKINKMPNTFRRFIRWKATEDLTVMIPRSDGELYREICNRLFGGILKHHGDDGSVIRAKFVAPHKDDPVADNRDNVSVFTVTKGNCFLHVGNCYTEVFADQYVLFPHDKVHSVVGSEYWEGCTMQFQVRPADAMVLLKNKNRHEECFTLSEP